MSAPGRPKRESGVRSTEDIPIGAPGRPKRESVVRSTKKIPIGAARPQHTRVPQ